MPDLWPDDFGTLDVPPPLSLLKEQARIIGNKTKGRILGEVITRREGGGFAHDFSLVAPFLDNYTYNAFTVLHSVKLYPAEIISEIVTKNTRCESPAEFQAALSEILKSEQIRRAIAAIIAQTEAVMQ